MKDGHKPHFAINHLKRNLCQTFVLVMDFKCMRKIKIKDDDSFSYRLTGLIIKKYIGFFFISLSS